jgi:hypothetical protein
MVVLLRDNCIELLPQVVVLGDMVVFFGEIFLFLPPHLMFSRNEHTKKTSYRENHIGKKMVVGKII